MTPGQGELPESGPTRNRIHSEEGPAQRSGLLSNLMGKGYADQLLALKPTATAGAKAGPAASAQSGAAGDWRKDLSKGRYAALDAVKAIPEAPAIALTDTSLAITDLSTWLQGAVATLNQAIQARELTGAPMSEVLEASFDVAIGQAGNRIAVGLAREAERMRTQVVAMTNASSVAAKDGADEPTLPTAAETKALGASVKALRALTGWSESLGTLDATKELLAATATAQDATLAILQAQSVLSARATFRTNMEGVSKADAEKSKRPRAAIDEVFKDAGMGDRASVDSEKNRIFDWCGMFVVASMYRGGGIDEELRSGYLHVNNVKDTFQYKQRSNAKRAPASIWADGAWYGLKEYHESRGSARRWTPKADIAAAVVADTPVDIRPGDVALIDHRGGSSPSHIVMVESYDADTHTLVTIEGNIHGIKADTEGKAERLESDDSFYKAGKYTQTGTGVHVRDLTTTSKATKAAHPKEAVKPPKGAQAARSGATVFGVGRPSFVDFEEHEYATNKVPEALRHVSPTELKTKAHAKDRKKIDMHKAR